MRSSSAFLLTALSFGSASVPSGGEVTPLERTLASAGFSELGVTDGVTVYRDEESGIVRVAAEGEIDAAPARVLEALVAYERHPGAIERVCESRVLERADGSLVVYQRLSLPIISDRDFVLRVEWGGSGDTTWVAYRAVTDAGPEEQDGIVRVKDHVGSWQLRPARDGAATRARYQMHVDLAGDLPAWMAGSHAGDEIPALFAAIGRLARATGGE